MEASKAATKVPLGVQTTNLDGAMEVDVVDVTTPVMVIGTDTVMGHVPVTDIQNGMVAVAAIGVEEELIGEYLTSIEVKNTLLT
jgi:hypothetical protein